MSRTLKAVEIFKELCHRDINTLGYTKLLSIPEIAKRLETSNYQVRKTMELLRSIVDVESGYESCYDEINERQVIVRGFRLTDRGRDKDLYKCIKRQEARP